ncbi:MAG: CHRD domain-containing protein [Myxococcota bacterium]|nr:CHRD domain-containing protein [Myxococcota bacterium]
MKTFRAIGYRAAATALSAGMLFACSSDSSSPTPTTDGGTDSTTPVHEGGAADTGTTTPDSGVAADTGVATDTGVGVDATDGGSGNDGSTADAADGASAEAEAAAPATAITYTAVLDGNQETPPVMTTATGTATLVLSADRTTLTYHVTHDVVGATGAHIHLGAGGESVALIFPLAAGALSDGGVDAGATSTIDGMISLVNGTDAGSGLTQAQIVNDLETGMFYVNVHSATHTGGEIRGQILHPLETLYVATLTGKQEAPNPVTTTATGDSAVILNAAKNGITYHLHTTATPTAAHIHSGIGSISGPVVFPLGAQPPASGTIDGTQSLVTADGGVIDAAEIAAGHWYVNVHTAANPNGELRGQLLLPGQVLYTALMSPANEVPPVTSTATGGAQLILGTDKATLAYEVVLAGFTATAAHIHVGTVGVPGAVLYPLTLAPPGAKGTQAVTPADIANLDASGLYVNAHSATNMTGEIRGQIVKQ